MDEHVLHRASGDELDTAALYALLRLRVDVFVVEQSCPYPELDGRDLHPSTVHFWLSPPGERTTVLASLRLLRRGAEYHIGRVVTAREMRRAGLARVLIRAALDEIGPAVCALDAQSHLAGYYATFGFEVTGDEFEWDGVMHVPMRRLPIG